MIIFAPKNPGAVQKYALDFTADLNGATISGAPTITPDGVVLDSSDVSGNLVEMLLSGGTAGTVAKVSVSAATSSGETLPGLLVLPIGGEAVSLDEAKAQQRIEGNDEDAMLAGLLRGAIGHIEKRTSKNLTAKIVTQKVDGFGSQRHYHGGCAPGLDWMGRGTTEQIRLWQGPVSEILSIEYDDVDGVTQTLADFRLVDGADARLLPAYGACWPVTAFGPGTVRITYVAGYDPAELPPELTTAAILLFGHFNANREAVIASDRAAAIELPLGVEALISPYCSPGIA